MGWNIGELQADFPKFAETTLWIRTVKSRLERFVLNRPQRRLWEIIKAEIAAERPVRVYILKARQLGFSTFVQGLLYWVTSLNAFRNALVVSHEDRSAVALFNKSETFLKFSPPELRPMQRFSNRQELYFANPKRDKPDNPGLESRIVVQTANNKNLGASLTIDFAHFSEIARYEELLSDVDGTMSTVLQTIPEEPGTFVIYETTAQGLGYAKDVWDDTENGFIKFFASWVSIDRYTSPDPLKLEELDFADDAKWGDERKILEQVISELRYWYPEMTDAAAVEREALKRLRWRRRMLRSKFRGKLDLFRQEYPLTPEEAFITSGKQVFSSKRVAAMLQALKPSDEHPEGPHPAATMWFNPEDQKFVPGPYGPLKVYEPPQARAQYAIGGDVGEGVSDSDPSALQVLKLPDMRQVAVFNDVIRPDLFASVAAALGYFYNTALVAVENNAAGVAVNLRLTHVLNYPSLYVRQTFDDVKQKYVTKMGWSTNRNTKPVMITRLREDFENGDILVVDEDTLREMGYYVQHKDGSLGALKGKHDDYVMSLAIAIQASTQVSIARARPAGGVEPGSVEWWFERSMQKHRPADLRFRDFGKVRM